MMREPGCPHWWRGATYLFTSPATTGSVGSNTQLYTGTVQVYSQREGTHRVHVCTHDMYVYRVHLEYMYR
jgi:hypothetical protein